MRSIAVALLLLLLACGDRETDGKTEQSDSRPNIVLIVADDHGKDALGCYGNPVIRTPHLDALAADGTRYDRAFCTTSSCSASRSVILSGLHNHRNGQFGHSHDVHHFLSYDTVRSLPVLLEEAGYRTARIGKYHLAPEEVYHFQRTLPGNPRSPVAMADASRELMEEDTPFFLYFCSADPHRDGTFAEELPHAPDRFGNRPEGYPGVTEVTYDPADVLVPDYLSDTPATRAELAQYYQSVSRLDHGVGRLVRHLKETGRYDNTLIVYISDNGAAFPGAKTTLYEPGMQLPCIIKFPGQKTSAVSNQMVSWTDLTPSLLAAAGAVPQADRFDGQNIGASDTASREEMVYASHTFHEITMYYPIRVARGERYKLLVNFAHQLPYPFASDLYESKTWQSVLAAGLDSLGGKSIENFIYRPRFELYDVISDPRESVNLADDPAYADVLENLQKEVYNMQLRSRDPWVVKWEYE